MTQTQKSNKTEDDQWDSDAYSYHGRNVEVRKQADRGEYRLFIDGHEIVMKESAHGIYSEAMMYQVFGSPYELAEALIRDLGTSPIIGTDFTGHVHHSD